LTESDFLKYIYAQNLQYSTETFIHSMNLIGTGYHQVNADCDPYLGSHRVLARAVEGFDSQVLFDPLEKEFDLPPAFVNRCDCQRRQIKVVRQKDQALSSIRSEKTKAALFDLV
jgi:hypothetical protein